MSGRITALLAAVATPGDHLARDDDDGPDGDVSRLTGGLRLGECGAHEEAVVEFADFLALELVSFRLHRSHPPLPWFAST